jgi:hypothetical protein
MGRRAILLLTVIGVALVVALTACGGASNAPEEGQSTTSGGSGTTTGSGNPYNVDPSMASLQEAGWEVQKLEEPQDTYTVPQIGYLEATAPDEEPVDLQFFESPEDAKGELDETKVQEAPFEGTTIGNVLVFDPEADTAAVSADNLQALQELLK